MRIILLKNYLLLLFSCIFFVTTAVKAQDTAPLETIIKEVTRTAKPWTRWWWMGSAVDKKNLRKNLIALDKAGIGGVEITPIYGVKGEEKNFLEHLSLGWIEMLEFTISTADSLEMGVDLVLGTGWPYGGSQVERKYAASKLVVRKYKVDEGEHLEKIITPDTLEEKQPATLKFVLAYAEDGTYKDLTDQLGDDNSLSWKAPDADYTVYAVFTGKTGQMVKRAAPGGKGYTLDHYSEEAFKDYIKPYNEALKIVDPKLRAIFNDSYEVYGTDFTPSFFKEFEERRGYDLKPYLPLLVEKVDSEKANRIRSDYRQTLSDLLLLNFTEEWTEWAHDKNLKTRLQAHGSPGNLIDLYAAADIPEAETFGSMPFDIPGLRRKEENIRPGDADPVMLKFSSSAAHISGKPLTSSETFTWLREHFKTALSHTKPEAEELFLAGVNHIFLHGSTYSPERAAWPGWKFYASVNFSPINSIWEDAPAMFSYLTNTQALLQAGQPDNDILLYWPIHDIWDDYLNGELFVPFKIHSLDQWLHHTSFYKTANQLMERGYGIDFISDRFISEAKVAGGMISLPGGNYKSLVVPDAENMPLQTVEKLLALKKAGANIIYKDLPESVPGFKDYESRNRKLNAIFEENNELLNPPTDLLAALEQSEVLPETLTETGLKFIKRTIDGKKTYFIVNHTAEVIDEYIPLRIVTDAITIYNPATGNYGNAVIRKVDDRTLAKVNIAPGESLFLISGAKETNPAWEYFEPLGTAREFNTDWEISFMEGGPELPEDAVLNELESWVELSPEAAAFSGTAVYETEFEKPDIQADNWMLQLGDVRESAKVWLNGEFLGTVWSNPFQLKTGKLEEGINQLRIQVTNLPANRLRDLEMRGEEWKIFYEINMVTKDYEKFDATKWDPSPSGLLGPVTLTPLKRENQ